MDTLARPLWCETFVDARSPRMQDPCRSTVATHGRLLLTHCVDHYTATSSDSLQLVPVMNPCLGGKRPYAVKCRAPQGRQTRCGCGAGAMKSSRESAVRTWECGTQGVPDELRKRSKRNEKLHGERKPTLQVQSELPGAAAPLRSPSHVAAAGPGELTR